MTLQRPQQNRPENQNTHPITISITAQSVIDQKNAEIEALRKRLRSFKKRENDGNDEKHARENKEK